MRVERPVKGDGPSQLEEQDMPLHHDIGQRHRRPAWRFALLLIPVMLAACTPDQETTGSVNACAAELFSTYHRRALDECVAVCQRCQRGLESGCRTSCSLNGAS
jgi:hypothetical protein